MSIDSGINVTERQGIMELGECGREGCSSHDSWKVGDEERMGITCNILLLETYFIQVDPATSVSHHLPKWQNWYQVFNT